MLKAPFRKKYLAFYQPLPTIGHSKRRHPSCQEQSENKRAPHLIFSGAPGRQINLGAWSEVQLMVPAIGGYMHAAGVAAPKALVPGMVHQEFEQQPDPLPPRGGGKRGRARNLQTLGLQLVDVLVTQLKGEYRTDGSKGMTTVVRFPLKAPA